MTLNRRRFLAVAAAGSAVGLAGLNETAAATQATVWQGVALGAEARIIVDGDPSAAHPIITSIRSEIDRLEALFSLNRRDSAISRLNREGRLDRPEPDFLALISMSGRIHAASGGAFDPTIQPVWRFLAERYSGVHPESTAVPALGGWDSLSYSTERVAFRRPGMAVSFNGIAQGYITDRITDLLRSAGMNHLLVDMGELRSVGPRVDGTGWPVKVPAAGRVLHLAAGRALAVSHTHGTTFDRQGQVGHIIDPRNGAPVTEDRMVAVEAPNAALADGISTALCASGRDGASDLLEAFPDTRMAAVGGADFAAIMRT